MNTIKPEQSAFYAMYSCMPVNPSCVEEPCPAQPRQVVTIPTIEVGKEGLAAFTVWINVNMVNGFPSKKKKMNICTNEGPDTWETNSVFIVDLSCSATEKIAVLALVRN